MRKAVITGLTALALAVPVVPAHADPNCTEDCHLNDHNQQYYLDELRHHGMYDADSSSIDRGMAICARLNQGGTREQARSIAGDGSDRQTDVVVNAAIHWFCPNQAGRV